MSQFSEKLRNARLACGFSVTQAVEKLRGAGVSISVKTLYNWEAGTRTPDADAFMVICDVYDVRSFEQFDGYLSQQTQHESEMLRKYRALDQRGRSTVDAVIEQQYAEAVGDQTERSPQSAAG